MDITIIEWEDSFNPLSGWQNLKELEPSRTICISVGILIHETDTTIFIAGSYAEETAHTVEQVNGVMSIPKGCIIKRETVFYESTSELEREPIEIGHYNQTGTGMLGIDELKAK